MDVDHSGAKIYGEFGVIDRELQLNLTFHDFYAPNSKIVITLHQDVQVMCFEALCVCEDKRNM